MDELELALKKLIVENSRVEVQLDEITNNSSLVNDFGYDSIAMIKLIVGIETELEIVFDDNDLLLKDLEHYGRLEKLVRSKYNG